MAFNRPAAAARSNNIPANKKAVGYLNFYLPKKDGGRRKLGAITLREAYANEATLADWLMADPERIKVLLAQLQVEYNPAVSDESAGFDLPE
jgi:hypothetical protein